jgi:hypothetical protein
MAHAVLDHLVNPDPEFGEAITSMLRRDWPKTKAVFTRWADEDSASASSSQDMISKIEARLSVL